MFLVDPYFLNPCGLRPLLSSKSYIFASKVLQTRETLPSSAANKFQESRDFPISSNTTFLNFCSHCILLFLGCILQLFNSHYIDVNRHLEETSVNISFF